MNDFQNELSILFDKLEKNNSTLIDQIFAYIKLIDLSKSELGMHLFGESLKLIIIKRKIFGKLFNDDVLAYAFLSKVSFEKLSVLCQEISAEECQRKAKDRIFHIFELLKQNELIQNTEHSHKRSKNSNEDIFDNNHENEHNLDLSTELEKFNAIKSTLVQNDFWKEFGNIFQILSLIYRHLSSIPATNSSVERAFSQCKYIFDDLSGNLSEESLEAQLMACIQSHNK